MKNKFIKFRVSALEKKLIQKKAENAGLPVAEFLRRLALNLELKNKLTEEEIKCYLTLTKYANNFTKIGNLFKLGDLTGVKEETVKTAYLIKEHLKKLK